MHRGRAQLEVRDELFILRLNYSKHVFAAFVVIYRVVAKGDAREVGDRELELFQICQSSKFF